MSKFYRPLSRGPKWPKYGPQTLLEPKNGPPDPVPEVKMRPWPLPRGQNRPKWGLGHCPGGQNPQNPTLRPCPGVQNRPKWGSRSLAQSPKSSKIGSRTPPRAQNRPKWGPRPCPGGQKPQNPRKWGVSKMTKSADAKLTIFLQIKSEILRTKMRF